MFKKTRIKKIALLVLLTIPGPTGNCLSKPLVINRKSGKTNHFVLAVAALCVYRNISITEQEINENLYNSTVCIKKSGVLVSTYGNGIESLAVAGEYGREKLKALGAKKIFEENINGVSVYYAQKIPAFWRIKNMINKIKSFFFPKPTFFDKQNSPSLGQISDLDKNIILEILSFSKKAHRELLEKYKHKVFIESEDLNSGRTMYLLLDNPAVVGKVSYPWVKFKGVRPKPFDIFGVIKHRSSLYYSRKAKVETSNAGPFVMVYYKKKNPEPFGSMSVWSARNEYIASKQLSINDLPLFAECEGDPSFVVYLLQEPDYRITSDGGVINICNKEKIRLGNEKIFDDCGILLKGIHDRYFSHGSFHISNVGFRMKDQSLYLKDFEDCFSYSQAERPEVVAAYRWGDIVDFVVSISLPYYESENLSEANERELSYKVERFIRSYFKLYSEEDEKTIKDICFELGLSNLNKLFPGENKKIAINFLTPTLYYMLLKNAKEQGAGNMWYRWTKEVDEIRKLKAIIMEQA